MANMQMNKTPMPEQEPNIRNANFEEVALGYTLEQAVEIAAGLMREQGMSASEAAKTASQQTGLKKGDIYRLLME